MVAARIVHARGGRGSQQRGSRSSKGGARGGAPPQLPPPLTEARVEAAEKKGRRGGAVVAVDLLELDSDLPGVEVSEDWVRFQGNIICFRVLDIWEPLLHKKSDIFEHAFAGVACRSIAVLQHKYHPSSEPCRFCMCVSTE